MIEQELVAKRLNIKLADLKELITSARQIAKEERAVKAREQAAAKKARARAPSIIADIKATVGTDAEQEQIALGSRILTAHRRNLRWSLHLGWLSWDGSRWARDETNQIVRCAKEIVRQIYIELAAEMDDEE